MTINECEATTTEFMHHYCWGSKKKKKLQMCQTHKNSSITNVQLVKEDKKYLCCKEPSIVELTGASISYQYKERENIFKGMKEEKQGNRQSQF